MKKKMKKLTKNKQNHRLYENNIIKSENIKEKNIYN